MENKETALSIWIHEFDLNEVEIIWLKLKMKGCNHGLGREGVSLCLRPPVYYAPLDDFRLCEKHAEGYLEEDADDLARHLECIKEGVRQLTRRGLPVSMLAARLASVELDDCFSEDTPKAFSQAAE